MAQRIFQSFRRNQIQLNSFRKKQDTIEVVGSHYKINVFSNIGFPAKPSSLAYDRILDVFALATRDGLLYVFGKPGVFFYGSHKDTSEIIKVVFITGTRKLLTLSDSDDIFIWEMDPSASLQPSLQNSGRLHKVSISLEPKRPGLDPIDYIESHITALIVSSSNSSIFVGTDQGSVAIIKRNTNVKKGVAQNEASMWIFPKQEDVLTANHIMMRIPSEKRARLRLDAVVVLSERPGYTGQLLIGYNSGVCLLYDLNSDHVLAILPCQYELESATWCGGSGLPVRGAASDPTQMPPHLGTRLLTAYGNGSLGVWQVPVFATSLGLAKELSTHVLQMMESPSMPYGPFPCKLISKVFWLPSHKGGITIFAGGLPRSIYANRNTVSILRGSNLDQAAAANLAAALRADSEGDNEDSAGEEEAFNRIGSHDALLANGLVPGAPVHVFDSDAPEHVCLDFPSPVVDVCPLGPAGGPASGLLVLCEEEIVAIDLLTPGWPILELPYLNCLHASSLTTYALFTQVDPVFLKDLESVGGKADAAGRVPKAPGISTRPWPIKGGHEIVPSSKSNESLIPSKDLLITGHENGVVEFWRLAAGGCARKIFSLFTGSLFEGEFGPDALGDANRGVDDEAEPWPPFRRVGLFDPFMDDVRAAVKVIQLVDRTLVVGGAAGQVSVWQLLTARPTMTTLDVPITVEVPGFRWKGHAPLTIRQQQPDPTQRLPGNSLFPIAVALCQPPSPVTCLSVCELNDKSSSSSSNQLQNTSKSSIGVLVGMGSAHGFALMHIKLFSREEASGRRFAANLVLHHSTIPANADALEEASVGDGWARRRTRELKNSLRDSFRRLKRMKSGRSAAKSPPVTSSVDAQPVAGGSPRIASKNNDSARVGLRKSVTRSTSGATRSVQLRGNPEAAASRIRCDGVDAMMPLPTGGEREICDRPTATANTALVRCITFGPPLHHRLRPPASSSINIAGTAGNSSGAVETPHLLASFFAGTNGGAALVYALFADNPNHPACISSRQATQVQLQHRAPIVTLRLIDTKTHCPLMNSSIYLPISAPHHASSPHHSQQPPPHLIVISEEQVRLFALPSISLKQKTRITAKDGLRIKTGDIMAFGQVSGEQSSGLYGIEFDCVFTNNGGQAVVLSVPHLRRMDTIALLGGSDVLEINSIVFATPASTQPNTIGAPSLGVYQIAPGQLAMFDVVLAGQKCSALGLAYRSEGQARRAVNNNTLSPSPRPQQSFAKVRADADARSSPSRANGDGL